jgi:hypothetical protein
MPPDPAAVVRAVRALREAFVRDVSAKTRPFGPVYVMADAIIAAIGELADHLAGGYFHVGGSAPATRHSGSNVWRASADSLLAPASYRQTTLTMG